MRTKSLCVIFGWLFLGTFCAPACADGGLLVLSDTKGGYLITVLTAPTPFRAGPVDISVLVQDRTTGELMSREEVTVRLTRRGQPPLEYLATREAATNKLFRAAQFDLPQPGRWELQVLVDGSHGRVVIDGEVEAAQPLPQWQALWLWIGWPALVIALFGIHLVLERRGSPKTGPTIGGQSRPVARGLRREIAMGLDSRLEIANSGAQSPRAWDQSRLPSWSAVVPR